MTRARLSSAGLALALAAVPAPLHAQATVALTAASHAAGALQVGQQRASRSFAVDDASAVSFVVVATVAFTVAVETPDGSTVTPANAAVHLAEFEQVGLPELPAPPLPGFGAGEHARVVFHAPQPGSYTVTLEAGAPAVEPAPFVVTMLPESSVRFGLGLPQAEVFTGEPVVVNAFLFDGTAPVAGATVTASITRDLLAGGEPPPPATLTLRDDGQDADGLAGDGIYSGALAAPAEGRHMVVARATGTSATGRTFQRNATGVFASSDPVVVLDPTAFSSTRLDDNGNGLTDRVRLRVGFQVPTAGAYRLGLILRAGTGRTIAGTAVGTVGTGAQTLDVSFPAALVRTLGADATAADPYTVALVRLDELRGGARVLRLREVDRILVAGITLADLERGAIELTGAATATGVDTDGDGRFDDLQVTLGLDVLAGGPYEWSASLVDGAGAEIGFAGGRGTLAAGAQGITLDFAGCPIGSSGATAPLGVRGLLVFGGGGSLVQGAVVGTFDFDAGQFACGPVRTTTTTTATSTSTTTSTSATSSTTSTGTSSSTTSTAATSTTTSTTGGSTSTTAGPTSSSAPGSTTTSTLPPAGPFALGDVFVGVSRGRIHRYDATGVLRAVLQTGEPDTGTRYGNGPPNATAGCAFDADGNLYVANFGANTISRFDRQGRLAGRFATDVGDQPTGLVVDGRGNVYVGSSFGDLDIRKLDASGTVVARFDVDRGVAFGDPGWIDLAPDQCTMTYTSEVGGSTHCGVKRFDVCRNAPLPDVFCPHPSDKTAVSPRFEALRLLPDGGLLLVGEQGIVRLDAAGAYVRFYDVPQHTVWTGIALAPDGRSFWAAAFGTSGLVHFDIESGAVLHGPIATGLEPESLVGVCVFGEAAAAREHACEGGADDDGDGAADCADGDCALRPPCHPAVPTTTTTSSTTTTLPPPRPASRDEAGTEFIVGFVQNDEIVPNDPAVTLYLRSTVPTEVTVEFPFHPPSRYLQSGRTQLSTRVAVTPGAFTTVRLPGAAASGWLAFAPNNVVHAFAADEFSMIMVTSGERGFAGSALALPVDVLGTEYVVTTYDGDRLAEGHPQFVVAAVFDDTDVTITPSADAVPRLPAGVPRVFRLQRGEGLRVQAALGTFDLTGTLVSASKPVSVTDGNSGTYVGSNTNFDVDHLLEVAQPVEHWGRTVPVADRPTSVFGSVYRIVAATDDTTVTLDGAALGTIDRGGFLDTGLLTGDHVFTADAPVSVTQFQTGGSPHLSDVRGDPSMGTMLPVEQYRAEHTFVAVHENQFHDGWVTVIGETRDVGRITLDGVPIDPDAFSPIAGSCFSVARLPTSRGTHATRSPGVHAVTVEGFAVVALGSHLYPAGATFDPVEPACATAPPACRCDATTTTTASTPSTTTSSSTSTSPPTSTTSPSAPSSTSTSSTTSVPPSTTSTTTGAPTSTTTSASTSTSTSSTSTTTVPPQGCLVAATFASILCRIDALLRDVTDSGIAEPNRGNLLRHLVNARASVVQAAERADDGRDRGAHTRLKSAARKMRSFAFAVRALSGQRVVPAGIATDYRERSDGIERDALTLSRTFRP